MLKSKKNLMSNADVINYAFQELEGIEYDLSQLLSVEKECQDQFAIAALCEAQDFLQSIIEKFK